MSKKRQSEQGRGRGRVRDAARAPAPTFGKFTGRVEGHPDGHGFLVPDGGEARVFLSAAEMRQALGTSVFSGMFGVTFFGLF